MSSVEGGHLAAALKRGGGNNQLLMGGMPLLPQGGEPASSDGEVFVPGPRFLSGKLCFIHCFRQVPPGADLLFRSEVAKPKTILIWARPFARSGHRQAAFGLLQHGLDLLAGDTGKPTQELVHRRAVFEVLKKSAHWHPSGFEHPGTAHLPGHPLDRRTLRPIQHRHEHTSTYAARKAYAGDLDGRTPAGVARVR